MSGDFTNTLPLVATVDEILGNLTIGGVTYTVRIPRANITNGASPADVVAVANRAAALEADLAPGARSMRAGANIASASAIDLGAATGDFAAVTGTTTITSLGTAPAGIERTVYFTGILTLTHNSGTLVLPGGVNIVTAVGDAAKFRSHGGGSWRCVSYLRATGEPVAFTQASLAKAQAVSATASDPHIAAVPAAAITDVVTVYSKALGSARALGDIHAVVEIDPADIGNIQYCRLRLTKADASNVYYSLTRALTAGNGSGVYTFDALAAALAAFTYTNIALELRANTGTTMRVYFAGVTEGAVYPEAEPARRAASDAILQAYVDTKDKALQTTELLTANASDSLVSVVPSAPISNTPSLYENLLSGGARTLGDLHAVVEVDAADIANILNLRLKLTKADASVVYYNLTRTVTAGNGSGVYTVDVLASALSAFTYTKVGIELRAQAASTYRVYFAGVTEGTIYPVAEPARRQSAIVAAIAAEAAARQASDDTILAKIATMLTAATVQIPKSVLKAFALCAKRRVTFILLSDSNGLHQGFGLHNGLSYALGLRWPQFASPLYGWQNDGYASQQGPQQSHNCIPSVGVVQNTGGPAGVANLATVRGYGYQDGAGVDAGQEYIRLTLPAISENYLHANLRLRLKAGYAKIPGGGNMQLGCRLANSPFTTIPLTGDISVSLAAGALTYGVATAELAAGTRTDTIQIGAGIPNKLPVGPCVAPLWTMVEAPDRLAGWQVVSIYSLGGKSMRDAALQMIAWSDEQIVNFFQPLRDLQESVGQPPVFAIPLDFGLNDQNIGVSGGDLPSVGPGAVTPGKSAPAYVDNFVALKNRLESVFTKKGWALDGLLWFPYGAHTYSDPDDPDLIGYRAAIIAYGNTVDRVQGFDVSSVVTAAELPRYVGGSGPELEHLTKEGHQLEWDRILGAI